MRDDTKFPKIKRRIDDMCYLQDILVIHACSWCCCLWL